MGTLQALMTTPVSAFEIVFSKFLASYLLYVFMWLLTLVFPLVTILTIPQAAAEEGLFSAANIATGYVFIAVTIGGALFGILGMLLAVPRDRLEEVRAFLRENGDLDAVVGEVLPAQADGAALWLRN